MIPSADTLYRLDFFPGLGWMLSKSIWDELSPKWPKTYPLWSKLFFCASNKKIVLISPTNFL